MTGPFRSIITGIVFFLLVCVVATIGYLLDGWKLEAGGDIVVVLRHHEDLPQLAQRYVLKQQVTYRGASVG